MHSEAVTRFITLAILLSQSVVAGELVIAPGNSESKVGDTTYFNCSTSLTSREIFWHHDLNYIYTGDTILDPYRGRFDIERNASTGSHNLVIHSVEPSDAGEYSCIDDDGHGIRRSAQLIVLENDPSCESNIQPDEVIGQNIFNIPPDEVQMTCAVTFYGNIPPQMKWKKDGDNSSITENVTSNVTPNNRLTYTLNFKGDVSLDKSSYVCQTTMSTQNQYNCTTDIIKVLYYIGGNMTEKYVFRGEEITCIASNSTFPCASQWYQGNYTCPLSCAETITAHLLGVYLCTVKCNVRGKDYYVEALRAVVLEPIPPPSLSISGSHIAAIVVPIIVIIIVSLAISIVVCRIRYKRIRYEERFARQLEEDTHLLSMMEHYDRFHLQNKNDELSMPEHYRLIGQNYDWLTENLDLESGLLAILHAGKVLSYLEYEQIIRMKFQFMKTELLLSIIRRKSFEDFKRFVTALNETAQGRIASRLTEAQFVGEREIELGLLHKMKEDATLKEKKIVSAAILSRKLFLVRVKMSKIDVYDLDHFNLDTCSQSLMVKNLVSAYDMCACKINNCLYIIDNKKSTAKEIMRISTKGKLIMHWFTKENAIGNLSATAEGNVIVTACNTGMLLEYSPDGQCIRKINLASYKSPLHAIGLNFSFIVSHGTLFDSEHRVCQLSRTGSCLKSFGDSYRSVEMELHWPSYLAVGGKGCVLVTDVVSNRLLLLDSNLEFKAKIVPKFKQIFRNPRKIYLNETTLVVIVSESGANPGNAWPQESKGGNSKENDNFLTSAEEVMPEAADTVAEMHEKTRKVDEDLKQMDEDTNFLDEDRAKIAEDTNNTYKNEKKMDEGNEQTDEGTEELGEDTTKIDQDIETINKDIKKVDGQKIDGGTQELNEDTKEDTKHMDEYTKKTDKDTKIIEERTVELDEDTKGIDKDASTINEGTEKIEKNTEQTNEYTKELDEDKNEIDGYARKMDEDKNRVDKGTEYTDDHTQEIGEDTRFMDEDKSRIDEEAEYRDDYTQPMDEDAIIMDEEKNRIDKDCVLLVFDIQPLLQKYDV